MLIFKIAFARESYGICSLWKHWIEGFAPVPGRYELRVEKMAGVGAGGGGRASGNPARDRKGHQLFRWRGYVLDRRQRGNSGARAEGFRFRARYSGDRDQALHADEQGS